MHLLTLLLALVFAILTAALPHPPGKDLSISTSANPTHQTRQLLQDDYRFSCCSNCDGAYSYDVWWRIVDDLCGWLGNGQNLWTGQPYYTMDHYCGSGHWDDAVCVYLQIQYLWCGGDEEAPVSAANPAGAMDVDYTGCIGYFTDTISPPGVCDGPPYTGGRIRTANNCWAFTTVASTPKNKAAMDTAVKDHHVIRPADCAPDARLCAMDVDANGTIINAPDALVKAQYGEPVEMKLV